ncbi:MAG: hypothetical protein QS748_12595 [Candidatus Endonucleobacter bathymodioli]|uniref:Uncharacterized protein n=1 Tax=Candidatus Endonucleibacter bathymodioli TaxID=539814 RepID=A0AA90STU1_9GAMM|nr:hypothetical protein [Candidatus Endonucleobacter bathymodioli]
MNRAPPIDSVDDSSRTLQDSGAEDDCHTGNDLFLKYYGVNV